jgi:ArsR family transcriptional regulator
MVILAAVPTAAPAPVLSPRERVAGGCCSPFVEPDLGPAEATRLALVAKALGDPTRLRIVDAVRIAAPEAICQCELRPLFEISQPALSKHLRVLVDAGVLGSERRGSWTFYFEAPGGLAPLTSWLGDPR